MHFTQHQFDDLVSSLYEAVEHHQSWQPFFQRLSDQVGCSIYALAIDKKHGALSYSEGANLPDEGELGYIQKYQAIDPRLPLLLPLPVNTWLHDHLLLDEAFVASNTFYQEFLIPLGMRYVSGIKIIDDEDVTLIFSYLRCPQQGPVPDDIIAFTNRLIPHMQRAARMVVKNFTYSTQALVGLALVNKLQQPVMLTSINGEVIHTNQAAQHLLQATALISIKDGKLVMPANCMQAFLQEAAMTEKAIKENRFSAESAYSYQTLQLHNNEHSTTTEKLYAFYSVLIPQYVLGTFGLRPLMLLMFYHPNSAPPTDVALLAAAFDLSPAECLIASLLADGNPIEEIATQLGKKQDTVRKQLQSIYQKTATSRQPELMRLLQHLPAYFE